MKEQAEKQWQEVLDYSQAQMKHYKITKKEVSEKAGLHPSNVTRIFQHKYHPSVVTWIKIHTSIHYIIQLRESVSESLKTRHNGKER